MWLKSKGRSAERAAGCGAGKCYSFFLVSLRPVAQSEFEFPVRRAAQMCDIDFAHRLCWEIAAETDAQKTEELAALLHAVMKENQDEARTRMAFFAQKYGPCPGWTETNSRGKTNRVVSAAGKSEKATRTP